MKHLILMPVFFLFSLPIFAEATFQPGQAILIRTESRMLNTDGAIFWQIKGHAPTFPERGIRLRISAGQLYIVTVLTPVIDEDRNKLHVYTEVWLVEAEMDPVLHLSDELLLEVYHKESIYFYPLGVPEEEGFYIEVQIDLELIE